MWNLNAVQKLGKHLLLGSLFLALCSGCQLTMTCVPWLKKNNNPNPHVCPHCGAPLDDCADGHRNPPRPGWGPMDGPPNAYGPQAPMPQGPMSPAGPYSQRMYDAPYMNPNPQAQLPQGAAQRPVIPQLPPNGGTMQAGAFRPWGADRTGQASPRSLPMNVAGNDGPYGP